MHDLELARLIHREREREAERRRLVRAVREARTDAGRETFVPGPAGASDRIAHPIGLTPSPRRIG
jgi:hypothetical protein